MNARSILSRAIEIAWQYKRLWVFGVLLAIFTGRFSSGYSFNRGRADGPWAAVPPEWIAAIVALALLWIAFAVFVGHWATGAVIGSVNDAEEGRPVSLSTGSRTGLARFWTLLGVSLAVGLPALLLGLVLLSPAIGLFLTGQPAFNVIGAGIICLLAPVLVVLGVAASLLIALGHVAAVISGGGVLASLRGAWQVLQRYPASVLLLWLVNTAVGCGYGCLSAALLGGAFAAVGLGFVASPIVGTVLLVPVLFLVALHLTVAGGLEVFYTAVWTLAYRQAGA